MSDSRDHRGEKRRNCDISYVRDCQDEASPRRRRTARRVEPRLPLPARSGSRDHQLGAIRSASLGCRRIDVTRKGGESASAFRANAGATRESVARRRTPGSRPLRASPIEAGRQSRGRESETGAPGKEAVSARFYDRQQPPRVASATASKAREWASLISNTGVAIGAIALGVQAEADRAATARSPRRRSGARGVRLRAALPRHRSPRRWRRRGEVGDHGRRARPSRGP